MSSSKLYDVFLSHNSADKAAVEHLAERLHQAGFAPFLDEWHLIPGEPWQEALEQALDQSHNCAVFLGPAGVGPWENEEMRAALDERTHAPDFRVVPVLLPNTPMPERGQLPRFLSRLTWVDFRQGLHDDDAFYRLTCGIRGVAPGARETAKLSPKDNCPYRGLQAFYGEHTEFFFGRDALTQWLVEGLRASRFLAVIGPSGSGKSSVVYAGLIPALHGGALPGSSAWTILTMRPGVHPLEELAGQFVGMLGADDRVGALLQLQDNLRKDARTLHTAVRLMGYGDAGQCVLIVVDQFEEVFTLSLHEDERRHFLDNLLYASGVAQGRTVVVLTMRADFYPRAAAYPDLADRIADHQVMVTPMQADELRQAIEMPAQRVGLTFDAGLVDTLLTDVAEQPGGLPLLEHALLELWERRQNRKLSFAAYREIGGVEGSIARRAEDEYGALAPEQQAVARRILLRLVQPGEGTVDTRRRARLDELVPDPVHTAEVEAVVRRLADARLLTTDREATSMEEMVDVAHEALIQGWPRLQEWIESDREALHTQRRLTDAALEWNRQGKEDSYLYRGARLVAAEEWTMRHYGESSLIERAFIDASVVLRDREATEREAARQREAKRLRRRALLATAIGTTAVVLAILAVWFGIQSAQNAELARRQKITADANAQMAAMHEMEARVAQTEAERQAVMAFSRQLASGSLSQLDARSANWDLALLLAIEAGRASDTAEAYTAIRRAFAHEGRTIAILSGHTDAVNHATWDSLTNRILTSSDDGTARVWDAQSGRELVTLSSHADSVWNASWNADRTRILTRSGDGTARVWDAESGQGLLILSGHVGPVVLAVWNSSGSRVLTADKGGFARVWDAVNGQELIALTGHEGQISQAKWNRAETRILTASRDGTARIWDTMTGKELVRLSGHSSWVNTATWNSDETRVLTASDDGTARLWDVQNGKVLAIFAGHTSWVKAAIWNSDETRILTSSEDATACLWDAETGQKIVTLIGHKAMVIQAIWNADQTRILTTSDDGTARVWDAEGGRNLLTLNGHTGRVYQANWNAGETRILTAGEDGSARIWDAENGRELVILAGHASSVRQAIWNIDETQILTISDDGAARVWSIESGAELPVLAGHTGPIWHATWNRSENQILAASQDGTARVWNAASGQQLLILSGHKASVSRAKWNARNDLILTVSDDGTMRVWDSTSGEVLTTLVGHIGGVFQANWNAGETRILSAGEDGSARVWDSASGRELLRLTGHIGPVRFASWNADEGEILTTSDDGTARVWDAANGRNLLTLTGHTSTVRVARRNSDESRILTASADGTARVWNAANGQLIASFVGHDKEIWDAQWNADETRIVTASGDHTARVWDSMSGEQLLVLIGHVGPVFEAVWNADGTRILTSSGDNTARVWDARSGESLTSLSGHTALVSRAEWSHNGTRILTRSDDGTARIWDADSGEELMRLFGHHDRIRQAIWNTDETHILTASDDGTVRQFYNNMRDLIKSACNLAPRNLTTSEWRQYMGTHPYRPTCPTR